MEGGHPIPPIFPVLLFFSDFHSFANVGARRGVRGVFQAFVELWGCGVGGIVLNPGKSGWGGFSPHEGKCKGD